MKKSFLVFLCIILTLFALWSCAQKPADSSSTTPKVTTEPSSGLEPGDHVTKEYYENGVLKKEETITVNIYHVIQKSDVKLYREDGSLEKHTVYKLGTGNDLVVFTEEIFFENEKTEKYIEYYTDGVIKIQSVYNENGTLKSCAKNYINGNPESKAVYDENGVAQKYCTYYTNGNKKEEKTLVDGMDNIILYYSEDGKLARREEFYANEKNDYKERTNYDEDGKISEWVSFYEEKDGAGVKEHKQYYLGTEQVYQHVTYYPSTGEGERCKKLIRYNEDGSIQLYEEYDINGNLIGSPE